MDSERTIILDAMGGDHGPGVCVEGAVQAIRESRHPLNVILVGDKQVLELEMEKHSLNGNALEIVHAPDFIRMDEAATEGIRRKDTSIRVSMRLVKERRGGAVVSAGNTGAVMAAGLVDLGRLPGVSRPAIASRFPTEHEPALLLDVGANPVCKASNLIEFAVMGTAYMTAAVGHSRPSVALLSIGEESSKGTESTIAAHQKLVDMDLNFVGNIEGRDILKGRAEVVVCDGFVGNILLKFAESLRGYLEGAVRRQISCNYFSHFGAILMGPFLRRMRNRFDYAEYGGAPLLGLKGLCLICHGSSSPKAIKNAIWAAATGAEHHVNDLIVEALAATSKIESESMTS